MRASYATPQRRSKVQTSAMPLPANAGNSNWLNTVRNAMSRFMEGSRTRQEQKSVERLTVISVHTPVGCKTVHNRPSSITSYSHHRVSAQSEGKMENSNKFTLGGGTTFTATQQSHVGTNRGGAEPDPGKLNDNYYRTRENGKSARSKKPFKSRLTMPGSMMAPAGSSGCEVVTPSDSSSGIMITWWPPHMPEHNSSRPFSAPGSEYDLVEMQHGRNAYMDAATRYAANVALEMAREASIEAAERRRRETVQHSRSPSTSHMQNGSLLRYPRSRKVSSQNVLSVPSDSSRRTQSQLVSPSGSENKKFPLIRPRSNASIRQRVGSVGSHDRPRVGRSSSFLQATVEPHHCSRASCFPKQTNLGFYLEVPNPPGSDEEESIGQTASNIRKDAKQSAIASTSQPLAFQSCLHHQQNKESLCCSQWFNLDPPLVEPRESARLQSTEMEWSGVQVVETDGAGVDDIGPWRVVMIPDVFHRFNPRQAVRRHALQGQSKESERCSRDINIAYDRTNYKPISRENKNFGNDGEQETNGRKRNIEKDIICASWPPGNCFEHGETLTTTSQPTKEKQRPPSRAFNYEFNIPFADIRVDNVLQKGKQRRIYQGYWHGNVTVHAYHKLNQQERKNFWERVSKLSMTRHENIALFMGACMEPPRFAIVMSSYTGPSLYEKLHVTRDSMSNNERMSILLQLSEALSYLHGRGKNIVVKCLNSHNIFITPKVILSLLDYSSLHCHSDRPGYLVVPANLVWYTAPELLQAAKASEFTYSSRTPNIAATATTVAATQEVVASSGVHLHCLSHDNSPITGVRESQQTTRFAIGHRDGTHPSQQLLRYTLDHEAEFLETSPSLDRSSLLAPSMNFSYGGASSVTSFASRMPSPDCVSQSSRSRGLEYCDTPSSSSSGWNLFNGNQIQYLDSRSSEYQEEEDEQSLMYSSVSQWLLQRCSLSNILESGRFFSESSKIFPWNMARSNSLPQIASIDLLRESRPVPRTRRLAANSAGDAGCGAGTNGTGRRRANRSFPALKILKSYEHSISLPLTMPEQCCTRATDIFAFGTIIYEIFVNGYPMQATPVAEYISYMICGHRADLTALKAPANIQKLIAACWSHEPTDRPVISEICIELVQRFPLQRRQTSLNPTTLSISSSLPSLLL